MGGPEENPGDGPTGTPGLGGLPPLGIVTGGGAIC